MKLTEYASKKIEKMTENKHLSINNKEEEIKKEDWLSKKSFSIAKKIPLS